MKNFKLLILIPGFIAISHLSYADQHDAKGFYAGFDPSFNVFDGHCDQVPSKLNNTSATIPLKSVATRFTSSDGTVTNIALSNTNITYTEVNINTPSCADSSLAFGFHVGYKFSRFVSVEGFYSTPTPFDLSANAVVPANFGITSRSIGSLTASSLNTNLTIAIKDEISLDSTGVNLRAQYDFENNMFVVGKLGVHFWSEKHKYQATLANPTGAITLEANNTAKTKIAGTYTDLDITIPDNITNLVEEKSGTGIVLGLGGNYIYSKNTSFSGGIDLMSGDINTTKIYAGLSYRF